MQGGGARRYRALALERTKVSVLLRRERIKSNSQELKSFGFLIGRPLFSVSQKLHFSFLIYDSACRFCGYNVFFIFFLFSFLNLFWDYI